MGASSERGHKKYGAAPWQSTTCVLCNTNCGIEVKVAVRHIVQVRGDYNANQIVRDPHWRRNDPHGALRIHPANARKVGVGEGDRALCESASGHIEVVIALDEKQRPGFVSLPHGYGMVYPDLETKELLQAGPCLNLMTSSLHCDPIAKTPYHKYILVRLQSVDAVSKTGSEAG